MAYDVTNFSDYISRENKPLTKILFAGGDTAKFARYIAGVKGSTSVPKLTGDAVLQAGFCKTPNGDTNVETVDLTVKPFTVFESFCEDDLQSKFPNMVLAPGSSNHDTPKQWQETIIDLKVSSINEQLELTHWRGDTAGTYNLYDGFVKIIDADGNAIVGNPTNQTISSSTIIDIIDGMFTALPAKVKRSGRAGVYVGDNVFDLFIKAMKDANKYHYDAEHDNGIYKLGGSGAILYRVYGLNLINRMFAGDGANFIVGNDVKEEEEVIEAWYDKTDDLVYLRTKGKSGVAVDNIDEIVEFSIVQ